MGGKTTGSESQTQTSTPDAVTDAWRNNVFSRGGDMLDKGPAQFFPGSTVAPMSAQTQAAFPQLLGSASAVGQGASAANQNLQNIAGGSNPFTGAVGAAGNRQVAPQIAGMVQGGAQQNPWANALGTGFGGANTNPYLDSLYSAASRPVINDVNAQFAKAGRYGPSAAYGEGMTKALGDVSANIYGQGYESERNRQLSGMQSAGSLYESGAGRALQGAGMVGDAMTGDANRALTGATGMASIYANNQGQQLQATSQMPSIWNGMMMPGQTQAAIGSIYDQQAQAEIDGERERWDYQQNAPWNQLTQYANMMNGMPTFGTTNTTGTSTQKNNPGALDYIGAAAKIGGMFV